MSNFSAALLWFGAAVSITEFLTGSYYAPLGFSAGFAAILLGHILGGLILFAVGYIGARQGKTAMETVSLAFGKRGMQFFSLLNVLQLFGWTAIMIYQGALAANAVAPLGLVIWPIMIGLGVLVWLQIYRHQWSRLNDVGMALLFILLLLVLYTVLKGSSGEIIPSDDTFTFAMGVEVAIAMPISWLPLISDYTKDTKTPKTTAAVSAIAYCATGVLMYTIGLVTTLYTGVGDIPLLLLKAGLGLSAVLIVIFSTVTTTFLDAYSAGVSAMCIHPRLKANWVAYASIFLGIVVSLIYPPDRFENFLLILGAVFAPMAMVMVIHYGLVRSRVLTNQFIVFAFLAWAIGCGAYYYFVHIDFLLGATVPSMLLTAIVYGLLCTLGRV